MCPVRPALPPRRVTWSIANMPRRQLTLGDEAVQPCNLTPKVQSRDPDGCSGAVSEKDAVRDLEARLEQLTRDEPSVFLGTESGDLSGGVRWKSEQVGDADLAKAEQFRGHFNPSQRASSFGERGIRQDHEQLIALRPAHQKGLVPLAHIFAQSPRMPVASKSPRSVVEKGSSR